MKIYLLTLIPLLGIAIGFLTVRLGTYLLFRWTKTEAFAAQMTRMILNEVNLEAMIRDGVAAINLPEELEGLLEPQLDKLVTAFKLQIPMASMFLTPTLTDKIKDIARSEIIKMLPDIESKIVERLQKRDYESLISRKIAGIDWDKIQKSISGDLAKASFAAGALGGVIGLVQLAVVWLAFH
jgi:hypothetical protein